MRFFPVLVAFGVAVGGGCGGSSYAEFCDDFNEANCVFRVSSDCDSASQKADRLVAKSECDASFEALLDRLA